MSEGKGTWEGLGIPRLGEYEQVQQDPTLDVVTLTGSTGQTGDFIVCQDSDGSEKFVVSSSGGMTFANEFAISLASTLTDAAVKVSVTSTGAIAAGTGAVSTGFLVMASSKANMNAAFAYSVSSTTVHVGACEYMLMSNGSKAPDYFLGVSASVGPGLGAAADNGFFDASLTITTFTCDHPFGGVKIMAGSVAYYLLAVQATGIT
jgi:hypothetical protein